jgi:hypothetical protein
MAVQWLMRLGWARSWKEVAPTSPDEPAQSDEGEEFLVGDVLNLEVPRRLLWVTL